MLGMLDAALMTPSGQMYWRCTSDMDAIDVLE